MRLNYNDARRVTAHGRHKKGRNRSSKRAYARLQKAVGGPDAGRLHLLQNFSGKCQISLHDPGGNLLIAFPCGILHHYIAIFLRHIPAHAHGVVVVEVGDGALRPKRKNVVAPCRLRTLGHIDDTGIPQFAGSPGQPPAVVAICGADKGDFVGSGACTRVVQLAFCQPLHWLVQALGKAAGYGV